MPSKMVLDYLPKKIFSSTLILRFQLQHNADFYHQPETEELGCIEVIILSVYCRFVIDHHTGVGKAEKMASFPYHLSVKNLIKKGRQLNSFPIALKFFLMSSTIAI
jgi:hypothetical protein